MAKIVYKSLATSKSAKAAGARAIGKKRVATARRRLENRQDFGCQ